MVVHLKPRHERKMLVNEIIDDLRVKLGDFPGMRVFLQNPPTVQLGGQVTKSPYQFSLYAPDKKELYAFAAKLEKEVAQVPGLIDVTSDLQISTPQVNVQIDRDRAAAVHVSAQQIENALYDAYGPRWVSTIYAASTNKVLLEPKEYRGSNARHSFISNRLKAEWFLGLVAHLSQRQDPNDQSLPGSFQRSLSRSTSRLVYPWATWSIRSRASSRELPSTFSTAFQSS
jgi:HAE1 family hydrophobic/amphiphilic exporter-1